MSRPIQRALVIGAAGQVGGALVERLGVARVLGTYRSHPADAGVTAVPFDLATAAAEPDTARRLVEQSRCDAVFIAAGMTWVDGCEQQPEQAQIVNCDGPAAVARAAAAAGARTVYFSSEYVFDGAAGPYDEEDAPQPLCVYGQSKLRGERAVGEADPAALILRTTVVYGPEQQGKNFAYQLAERLLAGQPLAAPRDQRSSPTYNRDLAEAALQLLEIDAGGVFHVVGPDVMDRAQFAHRVAAATDLDALQIRPVSTADLRQTAPRPLRAGLKIDKLRRTLPTLHLRNVEQAIAHWQQHQRGKAWPQATAPQIRSSD